MALGLDVWAAYEARVSGAEHFAIPQAPMSLRAVEQEEWCGALSLDLLRQRFAAHENVSTITHLIAQKGLHIRHNHEAFALALMLAVFELRHGLVCSWRSFALLFRKMLGDDATPWFASLFLGALGQMGGPKPAFELDDVLDFAYRFADQPAPSSKLGFALATHAHGPQHLNALLL